MGVPCVTLLCGPGAQLVSDPPRVRTCQSELYITQYGGCLLHSRPDISLSFNCRRLGPYESNHIKRSFNRNRVRYLAGCSN